MLGIKSREREQSPSTTATLWVKAVQDSVLDVAVL